MIESAEVKDRIREYSLEEFAKSKGINADYRTRKC